jgi:hypothetical protein
MQTVHTMDSAQNAPVFKQFRHNAKGAIKALREAGAGLAIAALFHPEVGDIDLRWGDTSDNPANKGSGLAKLIKWHPEALNDLQGFIEKMTLEKEGPGRIWLKNGNDTAILSKDWHGVSGNWLLTAYTKKANTAGGTMDAACFASLDDTATQRGVGLEIIGLESGDVNIAFDDTSVPDVAAMMARMKLTGELGSLRKQIAALGADAGDMLARIKLVSRSNQIRKELGESSLTHENELDVSGVQVDEGPELSDDPNSPNYRFRDTGYIANSRKEQAANMIKKFKDSGRRIMASELDWGAIETNPRAASELIVKSNLFGVTDWDGLKASGMEPGAGFLIDRVYASIATSPGESSPQARKDYALALQTIRDRFEASKTVPEVMAVLEDIGDELSGSQFNADETERYAAEKAALDVAVSAHEKLRTERQKLVDAALAFQVQVSQLTNEQNKRTRRKWQPDPEIEKKLVPLRAQHDQALADLTDWDDAHPEYKEEWVSTKTADGWTSGRHSSVMLDEIREITMRMRAMKEAARMRNIAESPVTRGWITFGERFFKLLNYRTYKGSDTFAGHVTNAKNGKIKDWGWAEKERATVKSATKQEIGFQLKVAENFERKGGRPVAVASTLDLKNMIGFKEVQSGNWVLKDPNSAKFHVEQTAGAMLDMSDILGIDAKALGLGGRLGMAFGARGTGSAGWKTGAAAAHYEPVHRVINLTKMGGGGSLGHEWAHAMDDVLVELVTQAPQQARNYGSEDSSVLPPGVIRQAMDAVMGSMLKGTRRTTETLTIGPKDKDKAKYNIDRSYVPKVAGLIKAAGGLDAAVLAVDAHFGEVTNKSSVTNKKQWRALAAAYWAPDGVTEVKVKTGPQTSEFMAEAVIMDFGQIDKYWSRKREMFARAFQSYLEDKLQEQDRRNDYLSVFADNKFHVDPLLGVEWKPYPEGQERAAINAAFDGFFAAIRAEKVFEKALENKPLLDAIFGEQAG